MNPTKLASAKTPASSMPDLPDPDVLSDSNVVIYDGECNFCKAQVRNVRRLDLGGKRLSFISLHDPRVAQQYSDLSHEDLMAQMYIIDPAGNRHGGSEAVKFLSRKLPILWLVMPILHLPGTAGLWRWLYNQVASRRYKLAGKSTCENDACGVHFPRS